MSNNNRRSFLKLVGKSSIGLASTSIFPASHPNIYKLTETTDTKLLRNDDEMSIIGEYGQWASSLNGSQLPKFSYRQNKWPDIDTWREAAKLRLAERMAIPDIGQAPEVKVNKKYIYDGLQIEELSWQLPYGHPTEAILLKPLHFNNPLPGILAFHDHSADKYYGKEKIVKISDNQEPAMEARQKRSYSGRAWANEIAKRGYVVLVSDAFDFASRRVRLQNVPERNRRKPGTIDVIKVKGPNSPEHIDVYNRWAMKHEHIMAKSLFSAGTTWPGVFFAEDKIALDVLSNLEDVDSERIGCAGLSGGGLRTNLMAALDPRIKCAVPVGFMTTWNDMILNRSYIHTWMSFIPLLPNELDFPEIVGLRAPLPTLVLNNIDDSLFTLAEMQQADNILKEVYTKAKAKDHYKCSFYPGPHKFDYEMQTEAFEWFDRWLKD